MNLLFRKLVAYLARPFSWGYSHCGRCKRTWNICEGHTTWHSKGEGCFPLCEECWAELTPKERVPYYRDLFWDEWERIDESHSEWRRKWQLIKKSVLNGK